MTGIELEKVAGCRMGSRWKTLGILVAFVTSAAVFFASFSSGRVPVWFMPSYPPSAAAVSHLFGGVPAVLPLAPSPAPVPKTSPSSSEAPTSSILAAPPPDARNGEKTAAGPSISTLSANSPAPSPTAISDATDQANTTVPEVKQANRWRERDLQLIYAKREIAAPPSIVAANDSELYAPLFLNVSVFKRSYELMESILKVYIYEEGEKPLFHTPVLDGIYASEGWFMRSMERSEQFVTKDPDKAHLFYLPYSSYQIRKHLYVPKSHSLQPISLFLKNYVDFISSKYPFWNTSRGVDHFLVACHDWGTYTTTMHQELRYNAIKVVCNADVSEGIFRRGRDVSLPETNIRDAKHPRKGAGGRPAAARTILAFYAGQTHGRVRPVLLRHWQGRDPDLRIYEVLPPSIARRMSYAEHMRSSRFCICPMGYEVNSPRIVEAITYGCVPVVIADGFALPFEDVLDWAAFAVVVPEREIPRLKEVLLGIEPRRYERLQSNVRRVRRHFLWNDGAPERFDLFHMILHAVWFNRLRQIHEQ